MRICSLLAAFVAIVMCRAEVLAAPEVGVSGLLDPAHAQFVTVRGRYAAALEAGTFLHGPPLSEAGRKEYREVIARFDRAISALESPAASASYAGEMRAVAATYDFLSREWFAGLFDALGVYRDDVRAAHVAFAEGTGALPATERPGAARKVERVRRLRSAISDESNPALVTRRGLLRLAAAAALLRTSPGAAAGDPLPGGPSCVAIDATSRFVYAASEGAVRQYAFDRAGALQYLVPARAPLPPGQPLSAVAHPSRGLLFVALQVLGGRSSIARFQAGPDGTLGPPLAPGVTLDEEYQVEEIAADPAGDFVYARTRWYHPSGAVLDAEGRVLCLAVGPDGGLAVRGEVTVERVSNPSARGRLVAAPGRRVHVAVESRTTPAPAAPEFRQGVVTLDVADDGTLRESGRVETPFSIATMARAAGGDRLVAIVDSEPLAEPQFEEAAVITPGGGAGAATVRLPDLSGGGSSIAAGGAGAYVCFDSPPTGRIVSLAASPSGALTVSRPMRFGSGVIDLETSPDGRRVVGARYVFARPGFEVLVPRDAVALADVLPNGRLRMR